MRNCVCLRDGLVVHLCSIELVEKKFTVGILKQTSKIKEEVEEKIAVQKRLDTRQDHALTHNQQHTVTILPSGTYH